MNEEIFKGLTRKEFKELMSEMRKIEWKYTDIGKREVYDEAIEMIDGEVFHIDGYKFRDAVFLLADCATGNYKVGSRGRLARNGYVKEDIESEYKDICLTLLKAVSEMQRKLGLDDKSKHEDPPICI